MDMWIDKHIEHHRGIMTTTVALMKTIIDNNIKQLSESMNINPYNYQYMYQPIYQYMYQPIYQYMYQPIYHYMLYYAMKKGK